MNKRFVAYSLLAHIHDNNEGIKDLTVIFLPLVKKALSNLVQDGRLNGQLADVKNKFDDLYGLDIPFPLLKKFLVKVSREYQGSSSKGSEVFRVFRDGSYMMKDRFMFSEFDEELAQSNREVATVVRSYEMYLTRLGRDINKERSLFEFIDKNRFNLVHFFTGRGEDIDIGYYAIQARFIKEAYTDENVYSTLRRIYLGSIISTYLTLDFEASKTRDLELVLDTSFIVSILDLRSKESNHTCQKILEISKKNGYKLSVLLYTIDETQNLLERHVEYWETNFMWQSRQEENIYNACMHRGLSASDLLQISSQLKYKLRSEGIEIVFDHKKVYERMAKRSREFEVARVRKANPDGALHDVTLIKYVQTRRARPVSVFHKSVCWFVTHTHGRVEYYEDVKRGFFPSIIRTEDLVSTLWLSRPDLKIDQMAELGLTQLVTHAITRSLPDTRVLNEFGANVVKHGKEVITSEDVHVLASAVASQSERDLRRYNLMATNNPEDFMEQLLGMTHKERKKQEEERTRLEEEYEQKKKDLEKRVGEIGEKFQKERETIELGKMRSILESKRETRNQLMKIDQKVEDESKKQGSYLLGVFGLVGLLFGALAVYIFEWSTIGWMVALLGLPIGYGLLNWMIYGFFTRNTFSLNPKELHKVLAENRRKRIHEKYGFDTDGYEELIEEIKYLEDNAKLLPSIPAHAGGVDR